MAGYELRKFFDGNIAASSTVTLITVPAGHRYTIKQCGTAITHNATGQKTYIRVNGNKLAAYETNGVGENIRDWTGYNNNTELQSSAVIGAIGNLTLEPGDVLSIVNPSNAAGTGYVSGVDFTI